MNGIDPAYHSLPGGGLTKKLEKEMDKKIAEALDGVSAKSAYQSYVDTTTDSPVKTEAQWIASLKGEQGEKGDKGDTGATGATGTTGPKGDKGDQGNSGYTGAAGELEVVNNLTDGGAVKALSAEMGKVLGNALKTNGTLMSIRAYSQEQFDALEELDDNTIYLIGITVSQFSITNNLTNCTTNNPADSIYEGSSYIAEITPDLEFVLDSVSIVMGGVDVTNDVYSDGEINIPNVTGNIVITIVAAASNLPVMSGLGVWLDAKDNLNDGSYHAGATKWISKVECGSLGNIEFSLLGEVSFVDGVARFAPTKSTVTSIWGTNPLCENGLGAIGSGDITIEIVLDSQFDTYTTSGDSIYFVGCNTAPDGSWNPVGRWRFGLYNKTSKNLDIWCNDGSGKFATLSNSMPAAGKQTLCFVRQNDIITFYRNGVSLGSVTKVQTFSSSETTALAIGNQAGGQALTNYYNCLIGDVYDVKVYGRALTPAEVAFNHDFNNTHYNLGL